MYAQRHWPNSAVSILIEAARSSFLPQFKITVLSLHLYNICFLFTNTTTRQSTHNTKVEERRRKREREHKSMSTLSVPPVPTSPRDDAIALYRAFKGTSLFLSLSLFLGNFYTNMLLLLVWSNVVNPLPKRIKTWIP